MALALITISGTSGKVQIYYKLGIVNHTIIADIGTIGIDDTSTSVRYTQLNGDAIATSTVFAITNSPFIYYLIEWKGIKTDNYKITSVSVGGILYTLPDTDFPDTTVSFLEAVNGLDVSTFKGTDYKITSPTNSIDQLLVDRKFIFKVAGTDLIEFKIKNSTNDAFIYIKGILISYPVTGFTPAPICSIVNTIPLS